MSPQRRKTMKVQQHHQVKRSSSKVAPPKPDVYIDLHGTVFRLNKACMASKSAKLDKLLSHLPPSSTHTLTQAPTDIDTFELAAKFCHGLDPNISTESAIPLAILASHLEMTEDQSPDNLIKQTINFITSKILPYWSETMKALRSVEPVLEDAKRHGLVDVLVRAVAEKVFGDSENYGRFVHGAKRRLFVADWYVEDLIGLSLRMFGLVVVGLMKYGLSDEQAAHCIYRYMKEGEAMERPGSETRQREAMETLEKLLPAKKGALHVKCLLEILLLATTIEASDACRSSLEARIARQLKEADMEDLFLPACHGYTNETAHDYECVRRILNHFCSNRNKNVVKDIDDEELEVVLGLVQQFVTAAAEDPNIRRDTFVSLLGMMAAMLHPTGRYYDSVYHAVDLYLGLHDYMTDTERQELCQVLDIKRLSPEAVEHAVMNEKLPLRVVAQLLFVAQVRIREVVEDAVNFIESGISDEQEETAMAMIMMDDESCELDKNGCGTELEEECKKMEELDIDVDSGRCKSCGGMMKKRKRGLWEELKGKLGCLGGLRECKCYCKNKIVPSKSSASEDYDFKS